MKSNEQELKIGDNLLALGPHYFEKVKIISADNGVFTLSNKIKITSNLLVVNNSKVEIKPFNEEEYNYLVAKNKIPRVLEKLESKYKYLSKEDLIKLYAKLEKVINKYF